jgi:hypothetical protein
LQFIVHVGQSKPLIIVRDEFALYDKAPGNRGPASLLPAAGECAVLSKRHQRQETSYRGFLVMA